jgi:hypothetical protein
MRPTKNEKLWLQLTEMKPLDHWPKRPAPFDFKDSQVVHHIMQLANTNLRHAVSLFNQAKKNYCIIFDASSRRWLGNRDWAP